MCTLFLANSALMLRIPARTSIATSTRQTRTSIFAMPATLKLAIEIYRPFEEEKEAERETQIDGLHWLVMTQWVIGNPKRGTLWSHHGICIDFNKICVFYSKYCVRIDKMCIYCCKNKMYEFR